MKRSILYFVLMMMINVHLSAYFPSDKPNKIRTTSLSQVDGRFSVNADLSGSFLSFPNKKNFSSTPSFWNCSIAAFAMYDLGKIKLGIGGRLGLDNTNNTYNSELISSLGMAVNYQYGSGDLINYQVIGRVYYDFIRENYGKTFSDYNLIFQGFSGLVGWGPVINFSKFQISPVFKINILNTSYKRHNLGDYLVKSGFVLNLNFPISK